VTTVALVSAAAGLASVLGGVIALIRRPTSLVMSVTFGFASGVLIATVTLEMLPGGIDLSSLGAGAGGFLAGFLAVYLLDLYINRWHLAGEHAAQYPRVRAYHRSHRPRGDRVTVLRDGRKIATLDAAGATQPELVRLMVGHDVRDRLALPAIEDRPPLLEVSWPGANGQPASAFALRRGEILGIAGFVGAGRSRLARAIAGAGGSEAIALILEGRERRIRSPGAAIELGISRATLINKIKRYNLTS